MKLLLGSILTLALIIIGVCIYKSYKETHKLARTVGRTLIVGFIIVFFNIVSLYTTSEAVCLFAYSAYFVASDWLLYYLLKFSIEYIGGEFEKYIKKKVMIAVLLADSIWVALNNVFGHLFKLNKVILAGDEIFYELRVSALYYIHYAIILMLVIFCLVSLLYMSVKAPAFYRGKYLVIAIILIVLVVLNFLSVKSAVDISVIGYVVEGICIYYCAFMYTPQKLLPKTLFQVTQDMGVALLVIDMDGKRLYSNKYAEELLDETGPLVDKDGTTLAEWCHSEYINTETDFVKERSFFRKKEELILKIQLQRMLDSKSHVQGGYFVIQDRTEELNKLRKEKYMATHDTLTGLYNKVYFVEKVEQYIRNNPEAELLLLCTDIKDFKLINDFLGPKAGDEILVDFANMLRAQEADALVYGRLENDIFAILMSKTVYYEMELSPEKQKAFLYDARAASFPIISYIGIYEITEKDVPVSIMCDRARTAIESIKGDYYKRIAYYDSKLRGNILYEQEMINDLEDALSQEQIKMYLQPQMSSDGTLLGAEALVRWIHPVKGAIMPGEFIPIFEKNGLISEIDKYIWEKACKQLRKWKDEGRNDLYISVNISVRDFYFLNVYRMFTELVEKYDIDPQNLKLEITETAIVMNFKRQMELITRLRQKGFIVEMDDFGSGYSSLNMLKDIHVDVLKIDMAFLKKAEDEERSRKILQMIITLSKHLEMPVITEGVETEEQVRFLSEMGCDMFQGYYFAKPMSVEMFEKTYLV